MTAHWSSTSIDAPRGDGAAGDWEEHLLQDGPVRRAAGIQNREAVAGETGRYGTVDRWTDGQIKLRILGGIHAYMAVFSQYSYLSPPICPSASLCFFDLESFCLLRLARALIVI